MSEIKTRKNIGYRKNFNDRNADKCKKPVTEYERKIVTTTQKTTDDSDYEQRRVNSLLHVIFKICELSGFWVENRIELKDRKTGKIWR